MSNPVPRKKSQPKHFGGQNIGNTEKKFDDLFKDLIREISETVGRFEERKGEKPTTLFIGKLEASILQRKIGKDIQGQILRWEGIKCNLKVWVMGASKAKSHVDVG